VNKLFIYAFFAGTCFGLWPIVMARSGIKNPIITGIIVSGISFFSMIVLVPFFREKDQLLSASSQSTFLSFAIIAGFLNAIGTLIFQKSMIGMSIVDQQRIWVIPTIVVCDANCYQHYCIFCFIFRRTVWFSTNNWHFSCPYSSVAFGH
jgi:hypothetical protein